VNLAKKTRLQRIFAHPDGRVLTVAVDHFLGYHERLPPGLRNLPETIARLVEGRPDAITMTKGFAKSCWEPFAGRLPLIVSSIHFTPDDAVIVKGARPSEALRLGADAIAVAIGVRGPHEGRYLKILCEQVEEADELDLPVIAHIYPRDFSGVPRIVNDPENILWAVRCGLECGADVIKVPFTGDARSFREIVATSAVPVVAAGGPQTATLADAVAMLREVIASGARGATVGRNIWSHPDPVAALRAMQAVVHV
jgi:class I fructose-bisphosphate aldolase